MRVFIVDPDPEIRDTLVTRVRDAIRSVQLRQPSLVVGDFEQLRAHVGSEEASVGFLGPGCYQTIEQSVERFRSLFPNCPVAVILENEVYTSEALELRKFITVRLMPLADIAQMAQFVLDSIAHTGVNSGVRERSGIAFVQMKGGVGATSLSAAFASCLSQHGKSTALIDLDDLDPMLTDWATVNIRTRQAVAEMLSAGEVPQNRFRELFAAINIGGGSIDFSPQPELYRESFHFKADVLEGSPSSESYITSLVKALDQSHEAAVYDCGRSWGVATFSLLSKMRKVFLVIDDDPTTLIRTAEALQRLYRESDDPAEFDFKRWHVVINGADGLHVKPEDVLKVLNDFELSSDQFRVSLVPRCEVGENWYVESQNGDRVTLHERGDESFKHALEDLAVSCKFLNQAASKPKEKMKVRDKLQKALDFLS